MERPLDLWDELNKHLAGYNWTSPMQQSAFGVFHASRGYPYVTCTGTGHYIRTVSCVLKAEIDKNVLNPIVLFYFFPGQFLL